MIEQGVGKCRKIAPLFEMWVSGALVHVCAFASSLLRFASLFANGRAAAKVFRRSLKNSPGQRPMVCQISCKAILGSLCGPFSRDRGAALGGIGARNARAKRASNTRWSSVALRNAKKNDPTTTLIFKRLLDSKMIPRAQISAENEYDCFNYNSGDI